MTIQYIDLIDIARSRSFGPVKAGMSLQEIGDLLGPPQYWGGFIPDEPFCCYMGFGGVELGFYGKSDTPRVRYAELRTARFKNREMRFCRSYGEDGAVNEVRIRNPFCRLHPSFDIVVAYVEREGLSFAAEVAKTLLVNCGAVLHFGPNCRFLFDEGMRLGAVIVDRSVDEL